MKLFVHVHIYYPNLWNEIKEHLANITIPYDMIVTFVENHPEIEKDILTFKNDTKIMHVPNKGWDIGPFLIALQNISLNDYDYVIKLHTKRDLPGLISKNDIPFRCLLNKRLKYKGMWRKELLLFIASKKNFNKCLIALTDNSNIGMISYFKLICNGNEGDSIAYKNAKQLLVNLNFQDNNFKFVAGTMFMVRAKLLLPLLNIQEHIGEFTETKRQAISETAHILERLLGGLVCLKGYTIEDVFTEKQNFGFPWREIFVSIFRFFFQYRITNSGYKTIKIFKIPVYHKK